MFDYGVIVIGVAVVLTVFSAIFWGLLCFLPASSMASLQAVIAASASTVGLQRQQSLLHSFTLLFCLCVRVQTSQGCHFGGGVYTQRKDGPEVW